MKKTGKIENYVKKMIYGENYIKFEVAMATSKYY